MNFIYKDHSSCNCSQLVHVSLYYVYRLLKLVKLGEFLKLLCSLDHNIGPFYRTECLPYHTVFRS
jgi:hypothetical protein